MRNILISVILFSMIVLLAINIFQIDIQIFMLSVLSFSTALFLLIVIAKVLNHKRKDPRVIEY